MEKKLTIEQVYETIIEFLDFTLPMWGETKLLDKYNESFKKIMTKESFYKDIVDIDILLSPIQGYKLMIWMISVNYYFWDEPDEVGGLLGSMIIHKEDIPYDPAMWDDWLECVEKVLNRTDC